MITRFCISLLLVLANITITGQAIAQARLNGYITEQNSGKKTVSGVQVTSLFANPIASGNDGMFILTFQNQQPGTTVTVQAEKVGWEVVNVKELSTALLAKPDARPLKIIMCVAGELNKARMAYYQIGDKYIRDEYDRRMKALDRQKTGWQQKAAHLEQDLAAQQKQLHEMADDYSRVNLDDLTAIERQAIELFKSGKIDESIELRESLNSAQRIKKAIGQKALLDSTIAADTRNLLNLAKEYQLKFDFTNAEATLEKLALADTTNSSNAFAFAYYLQNQNQYNQAIKWYRTALRYTDSEGVMSVGLNQLSTLYVLTYDHASAQQLCQRAVTTFERLAQTDPKRFDPSLATALQSLGSIYDPLSSIFDPKKHYDQAHQAYSRVLAIWDRLTQNDFERFGPALSMTLIGLGRLYDVKKEYAQSQKIYIRVLTIQERLAQTNPERFEPILATSLGFLGVVYQYKKEYTLAKQNYIRALTIQERLVQTNPERFEPDLAITLKRLASLYDTMREKILAKQTYIRVLTIQERLAQNNPERYEPDLASTLNSLGFLYRTEKDYTQAQQTYIRARTIEERLAQINPERFEPDLAYTLNSLGYLYLTNNEFTLAQQSYQRALIFWERLSKTYPQRFEYKFTNTLNDLGYLYETYKEFTLAQQTYQRALSVYERLAMTFPERFQTDVISSMSNTVSKLAYLHRTKNEPILARQTYQRALAIYERLSLNDPQTFNVEWAKTVIWIGYLSKANPQVDQIDTIRSLLMIAQTKLATYSSVPLATTYLKQAQELDANFTVLKYAPDLEALEKQVAQTEDHSRKALLQQEITERYRTLIMQGYPGFLKNKASSLGNLAWYQLFVKQFDQAEQSAREALNPVKVTKPDGYDEGVEWVNTNLALALLYQSKFEEAKAIYLRLRDKPYKKVTYKETFLADLEELEKAGITHDDVAAIRKLLRE